MRKLSIRDLDLEGKRVWIRVDFNVPLQGGRIVEDIRIRASLPTIELAVRRKARLVLASHLGRPKGKRQDALSLRPVSCHLSSLLGQAVTFAEDCVGSEVEAKAARLAAGQVLLLENLRFHREETENDLEFSRSLARLSEEYVDDAFGVAHRAHASTVGIPRILGKGAAGLLMQKELDCLSRVFSKPQKPVVAILAGKKIADKIDLIDRFLSFADVLLLGGGMSFTFSRAQGSPVGKSLFEEDKAEVARNLMRKAESEGVALRLPEDHIVAPRRQAGVQTRVVSSGNIPEDWMGLDIGPRTVEEYRKEIQRAGTIVWNGPLGVFEIEEFSHGTMEIARAVAESSALSVVGGGHVVSALRKAGVQEGITHISTGGGAALEFLAGKKLPGVEVLTDSFGKANSL